MCCGRDLNIQPSTCDANALNQCATPRSIEGPGPLQGQMLAKQQRCIVCEGSGLLCRLLALAEATYRNQYPSSCVVGVTKNFCHIFLGNHTGQLPDIWHRASVWRTVLFNAFLNLRHVHFLFDATLVLWILHRQICSQDNFCHIFLGNHRGQLPDIWHRASVWRTVSCNAFLNLRHVHFLFYATLNI